jgi:hypothetical protein
VKLRAWRELNREIWPLAPIGKSGRVIEHVPRRDELNTRIGRDSTLTGTSLRSLKRTGGATLSATRACYHSELYEFDLAGTHLGIVGCAVGAPYAVLVAEQMFAVWLRLLVSVTSSGPNAKGPEPRHFVLVTRALRGEGTSYHYQPIARSVADGFRRRSHVRPRPDPTLRRFLKSQNLGGDRDRTY